MDESCFQWEVAYMKCTKKLMSRLRGNAVWIALLMVCLVNATVYLVVVYPSLPSVVPTHFGVSGAVDEWGDKSSTLVLMGSSFIVLVFLWALGRVDARGRRAMRQKAAERGKGDGGVMRANARGCGTAHCGVAGSRSRRNDSVSQDLVRHDTMVYQVVAACIMLIFMVTLWFVPLTAWGVIKSQGSTINYWFILMIAAVYAVLGIVFPHMTPSGALGIRLPWTVINMEVWRKTHQAARPICWIMAALTALCAGVNSFAPVVAWSVVLIVLVLGTGVIALYSYLVWRRMTR